MADQPIHPIMPSEQKNEQKQPKNIIICCDGTGNEFGDCNSNVLKLYTTLDLDDETRQVAYYHPGVGTMGDPAIRHWIPRKWSVIKGLAFGSGFKENVFDAYRYLMEVYNQGDQIYLFGFSRGAYTARALAGLLHGYGLLHRGNEGHLAYAWRLFVNEVKKQRRQLMMERTKRNVANAHTIEHDFAFASTFSRPVKLRFVGVWDTVSSIGWIYEPLRLLSLAQNPIIDVARHAVSIDERRAFFRDNLYGPPLSDKQDIVQLWFPGVHSDVGGSYPREDSDPANTTLRWMLGELANNGAILCQPRVDLVLGTPSGHPDLDKLYTPPPAPFHKLNNSLNWNWWILQFLPQQYYDKDDAQINLRVPFWAPRETPGSGARPLHGHPTPRRPRNRREALQTTQPQTRLVAFPAAGPGQNHGQPRRLLPLPSPGTQRSHRPAYPRAPADRPGHVHHRYPRSGPALPVDGPPPPPAHRLGCAGSSVALPLALCLLVLGGMPSRLDRPSPLTPAR